MRVFKRLIDSKLILNICIIFAGYQAIAYIRRLIFIYFRYKKSILCNLHKFYSILKSGDLHCETFVRLQVGQQQTVALWPESGG
jgi:hypothetical protein